jgi:hypothetical protein
MKLIPISGAVPEWAKGSGSGDGDGSGSGYGYGYGYGSGYGSGYGDGSYWALVLKGFASKLPDSQRNRFDALAAQGVKLAFWRSDDKGEPANGGSGVKAEPGAIHETKGPLNLCSAGTLHATLIPPKWKGDRVWIVALHGQVIGDDEKMGCLKREIVGECLD